MKDKNLRRKFSSPAERGPEPGAKESGNEPLPAWKLARLYAGIKSPELLADKAEVERRVGAFRNEYESAVAWLSGAELGKAIGEYEEIEALRNKIDRYAMLLEADDRDNFAKTEPLKKWVAEIEEKTQFFAREISGMEEADLMTKLVAPELAQYAPWIARQRTWESDDLSEKIGKIDDQYKASNTAAWRRLYLETLSGLRMEHRGKQSSLEELDVLARAPGSPPEEKIAARKKMGAALKQHSGRVALIYNVIVKDMAIDAVLTESSRPDEDVHLENGLSPEIVDTMFDTVKGSFGRLSHRFYAWKVQQRGAPTMKSALLADLSPGETAGATRVYSWGESRKLVLRAFRKFSPRFYRIAQKFFDEGHIDAAPRDRKDSGAFTMPVGPGHLPFILLNFNGHMDDVVSSLAHELGHGIHQVLAERAQGMFLSDMPDTVAETASIFAEMLAFEEILQGEKDPKARRDILSKKVENMLSNGLHQLSYYDFERRVHAERKQGELSAERISDIWVETKREFYGPAVELDDYDRYYWMLVPHFFEMPFYVYSYSFAQMAVSALFQEYKKAGELGEPALEQFVENYTELLETGITKNCYEMFASFGLDPEKPEFWESGLSLIEKYLDYLTDGDEKKPFPKALPAAKPKPPGL